MHSDACASWRDHSGNVLEREEGHSLEEHRELRMLIHQLGVHICIFCGARHEERHPVLAVFASVSSAFHRSFLRVFVAVVVFEHSQIGQSVQQLVELCVTFDIVLFTVPLYQERIWSVLSHVHWLAGYHVQKQVEGRFAHLLVHFVLEDAGQSPILRVVGGEAFHLVYYSVCYLSRKLEEFGIRIRVALVFRDKLR